MIKIGIIGSRKYNDYEKVKQVVQLCMQKYGNDLCIISGGARGADYLGKQTAFELNLKYIEYNPAHENWNKYSGKPKEFYNKEYNVRHYFERNSFIAENSDIVFAFIPENHISNGTMDTVNKTKKLNKYCCIIN